MFKKIKQKIEKKIIEKIDDKYQAAINEQLQKAIDHHDKPGIWLCIGQLDAINSNLRPFVSADYAVKKRQKLAREIALIDKNSLFFHANNSIKDKNKKNDNQKPSQENLENETKKPNSPVIKIHP